MVIYKVLDDSCHSRWSWSTLRLLPGQRARRLLLRHIRGTRSQQVRLRGAYRIFGRYLIFILLKDRNLYVKAEQVGRWFVLQWLLRAHFLVLVRIQLTLRIEVVSSILRLLLNLYLSPRAVDGICLARVYLIRIDNNSLRLAKHILAVHLVVRYFLGLNLLNLFRLLYGLFAIGCFCSDLSYRVGPITPCRRFKQYHMICGRRI